LEEGFFKWIKQIRREKIRKKLGDKIWVVFAEVGAAKNWGGFGPEA